MSALKRSGMLPIAALLAMTALAGCGQDKTSEVAGPAVTATPAASGSTQAGTSAPSAPPVQQQQQQQANQMAEAMRHRGEQGKQ